VTGVHLGKTTCAECEATAEHVCLRCARAVCAEHAAASDACRACDQAFAGELIRAGRQYKLGALGLVMTFTFVMFSRAWQAGLVALVVGGLLVPLARPSEREVAARRARFFPRRELPEARLLPPRDHE